jgi:hypothetical protein
MMQNQIPSKLDQFDHRFDKDRAVFQTAAAGGAFPYYLLGHHIPYEVKSLSLF